ncbi:MAG: hypothetical protein AABY88_01200 [Pseudomonadota bacterium]
MMLRNATILAGALILSACATTPTAPKFAKPSPVSPPLVSPTGLDRVIGRNATTLTSLFGNADQDVREDNSRKLQFSSGICILDAYLYTPPKGKEPLVSYVDARQPDGKPIDRASCVAALTRRKEAR